MILKSAVTALFPAADPATGQLPQPDAPTKEEETGSSLAYPNETDGPKIGRRESLRRGLLLALGLIPFVAATPRTNAQTCDPEDCQSGSDDSGCTWAYCQEYCDTGSYCDVTVEYCDSGSGTSYSQSYSCY